MHSIKTENLRVIETKALLSPAFLHQQIPITASTAELISTTRKAVSDIIQGKDKRLLVVIGPCSIHDPDAALEYANRLKPLMDAYQQTLCILMRVYFEKPRTTVGWKGYINDPDLNESFNINQGLQLARKLLLEINELGVPTAAEFLDTTIPQYTADLISWGAIGARTVESQIHRELASGLSMPVGFKNGTGGNIEVACEAIKAAINPHHFLGITPQGLAGIIGTTGNPDCHLILRGGKSGPNYDAESVAQAMALLEKQGLQTGLMVDCSHGNSQKDHRKQTVVADSLCKQLLAGQSRLMGVMVESYLVEGRQDLEKDQPLHYGQSITDACIGWEDTLLLLEKLSLTVKQARFPEIPA